MVTERSAGEESIPYVIYFTDYSAGRKDPLKVITQYAQTQERKEVLVERLLEKNIKKAGENWVNWKQCFPTEGFPKN